MKTINESNQVIERQLPYRRFNEVTLTKSEWDQNSIIRQKLLLFVFVFFSLFKHFKLISDCFVSSTIEKCRRTIVYLQV